MAWAFDLGAGVVLAFAIGHWRGRMETSATPGPRQPGQRKTHSETRALFANRIRAIVQDDRGLNLLLSDRGDVPDSPPLYVRICDGLHCSSFVTFSGQEIQVGGQKITVLTRAAESS